MEIIGSMWCGKTWMAEAHGMSKVNLSDVRIRRLVEADTRLAFEGKPPHIIDEWQEVPALWDQTRLAIDEAAGKRGLYILTGSSTPRKNEITHSGSGRIARLHLRPMSLYESGYSDGQVSLSGLFNGEFDSAAVDTSLADIAKWICRGGWPGSLSLDEKIAAGVPSQYLEALISFVAAKERIGESRLQRVLTSLARNIGQAVTYQTLLNDISVDNAQELKLQKILSREAVERLINLFHDRFIIEDLNGWDAPVRSKSRVRTKPIRSFVDPSLSAALLGVNKQWLLTDAQLFGRLFEELCLRDLRIYASDMDAALTNPIRYYRDSDGLEVDVIIELRDGRWAGIEIKLGENKVEQGVRNLLRLKRKIAANPMARNPDPAFLAVLVGNTPFRRCTPEGVYVFPITSLTV
ncbi:MAG: DUF4143 domain-containing protein [Actinomycetes bacterium]|nr:DUF4143 domain-containing protein [Actinomycetes bacterium]